MDTELSFTSSYYKSLVTLMNNIAASNIEGQRLAFGDAMEKFKDCLGIVKQRKKKVMFIGNGASQSISSHLSTDFCKNGKIRAMAFTDPALVTTYSNDYGYPHVFEKPIELHADPGDVLVAISSSGRSENILLACKMARSLDCTVITLSGFQENNPLRELGDINFYVNDNDYGPVEIVHHSILHCILDGIMLSKNFD